MAGFPVGEMTEPITTFMVRLRLGMSSNWATARIQRNMATSVNEIDAATEAVNQLTEQLLNQTTMHWRHFSCFFGKKFYLFVAITATSQNRSGGFTIIIYNNAT